MQAVQSPLHQLAELFGVKTAYVDNVGRHHDVPDETLLAVLAKLGAPCESPDDVPEAIQAAHHTAWTRGIEPVAVVWEGKTPGFSLRVPAREAAGRVTYRVTFESGDTFEASARLGALRTVRRFRNGGGDYVEKQITLRRKIPLGYHKLQVETGRRRSESVLISAPVHAYTGTSPRTRTWGVFVPVYALHTDRSWGAGDLGDLEALIDWVRSLGGGPVATLPLLASYLDEPCDFSPYTPVSRLFWNEFYIHMERVPETQGGDVFATSGEARPMSETIEALRREPLVDYRRQMALKREVLERFAQRVHEAPRGPRFRALRRFVRENPRVEDYARFRAAIEKQHRLWHAWPPAQRGGRLESGDYDDAAVRYHLYVQFVMHEQMTALAARSETSGSGLYLDLPLGVHALGYDVWRERELFTQGMAAGAPPDDFFSKGQNWGFPPINPEHLRATGYRYLADVYRHHMRTARMLRIDHVMGLHRLWWVPDGHDATDGTYVHYRADELYAVAALESVRNRTVLVGEDLGTVPPEVRRAMTKHKLQRMYVVQFELQPEDNWPLNPAPAASVASINTHDMPTFAAYCGGLDIAARLASGLLDEDGAQAARWHRERTVGALTHMLCERGFLDRRSTGVRELMVALHAYLAAGSARMMLVSLEDMWLETSAQNVPGTGYDERPNWRRKTRYAFEEIKQLMSELTLFEQLTTYRRGKGTP